MKQVFFVFLISFSCLCSNAQFDYQKAEKDRVIKFNIKKSIQYVHKYNGGKLEKDGVLNSITLYNNRGNETEISFYREDKVTTKMTYRYDDKGRKVEFENYKSGIQLLQKSSYSYDDEGRKLAESGFNGDNGVFRMIYKYDAKGRNESTARYDRQNKEEEKWVYHYQSNKTKIEVFKMGQLKENITRTYDNKKNLIEELRIDDKGVEIVKKKMKYNSFNNKIIEEEFRRGKFVKKQEFEYDDKNRISKIYLTKFGKTVLNNTYHYNSKGGLDKETWYEGKPNDYSYFKYIYDSKGLLTKVDKYYSKYKYRSMNIFKYEFR